MKYLGKPPQSSSYWLVLVLALIKGITADNLNAAENPMIYTDENYTDLFPAMAISTGFHMLRGNLTEENLRIPFVEISPNDLKRDYSLRRIARLSNEITVLKTKLGRKPPCKWDVHEENCFPPTCLEAMKKNNNYKTGIYQIKPPGVSKPVYARCEKYDANRFKNATTTISSRKTPAVAANENDPWLTIQYRGSGAVSFERDWASYKKGFGNLEGDFFYGLEKIHQITQSELHEIWIELRNYDCEFQWARYTSFLVASEENNYALMGLGSYYGNAGDSFTYHGGQMWSTEDRDNDQEGSRHCARVYRGGWWYRTCFESNLNGIYKVAGIAKEKQYDGIIWENITVYSLQSSKISIRPIY